MILLIECVIGIILFTLIVVPLTLSKPLKSVGDYPPAIKERCIELKLIPKTENGFSTKEIIKKVISMIVFSIIFSLILYKFNEADTFIKNHYLHRWLILLYQINLYILKKHFYLMLI